ncbi:MAG: hypothetical protein AB7D37_03745 [Desulfovibrio sp.]
MRKHNFASTRYFEPAAVLAELREMEGEETTAHELAQVAVKAFCTEAEYQERLYQDLKMIREALSGATPTEAARLLDALLPKMVGNLDTVAFSHIYLVQMASDLEQAAPAPGTCAVAQEVRS